MNTTTLKESLLRGELNERLTKIYGTDALKQSERFAGLTDDFRAVFGEENSPRLFTAPGRTEVCGNHTDHNHGKVLAASINLDVIAVACKTDNGIVRVKSRGYSKTDVIDLSVLSPIDREKDHSSALIRGTAARFVELGYKVGGFDTVTVSDVLPGSGMSSSAAFEVLIGTIFNYMFNDGKISPVEIAQIAQYAENKFFGKPCGLMDQMACSVGGFVEIDFESPEKPVIDAVNFDFSSCSHSLCIVDSRASHADLTDEYTAIRREMEAVAACFGKSCLREVNKIDFYNSIDSVRKKCGERAVLRAIHFYADNERVDTEAAALAKGDFEEFKRNVILSGYSSYMYNQNVFAPSNPASQPVSLALALSAGILDGRGAWRVHGGGFAGTIQAFVPDDMLNQYKTEIEAVFGKDSCYILSVRAIGGAEI